MVKPLLEIERPWLTRDDLRGLIWRLTGLKNPHDMEQILRAADVYAVSQGPLLIERLRERDASRRRWEITMPLPGMTAARVTRLADEIKERAESEIIGAEPEAIEAAPSQPELALAEPPPSPPPPAEVRLITTPKGASEVWEGDDGEMIQRCTGCGFPKPYGEFHKDRCRWNGVSSRCKKCKSRARKAA